MGVIYHASVSICKPNLKCITSPVPKIMQWGRKTVTMGYVTMTASLSGRIVIHSWDLLWLMYVPNLQSLFAPVTKVGKATQQADGLFGILRGNWRSLESAPFDTSRAHTNSYAFCCRSVSESESEILWEIFYERLIFLSTSYSAIYNEVYRCRYKLSLLKGFCIYTQPWSHRSSSSISQILVLALLYITGLYSLHCLVSVAE